MRLVRDHDSAQHVAMSGHPVKGCMGGQAFAFISHVGKVQICGFLDVECGDELQVRDVVVTELHVHETGQHKKYPGKGGDADSIAGESVD